jgi:hypothetical protein
MSGYNPLPPRVWSRVQNLCTDPVITDSNYNVFIPLINKTVPPIGAQIENQMLLKANILQYKKNSGNLTKSQKYAQLAKGMGPLRKKSYATQSVSYTNPNTSSFQRINSTTIPFPNIIPGFPNNVSGPYQYNILSPYGCGTNSIEEGGSLVSNRIENPCSKEIIKECPKEQNCFLITDSDVPGFSNPSVSKVLCRKSNIQTFYPRNKLTMNNSANKWPQNYKGFVSACN